MTQPDRALTTVDAAYDYCRAITHKHGGNFSVGFRFLPAAKRRAVYAAYAFCRVADDIADEGYEVGGRQSAVGSGDETDRRLASLDEWQRELDAAYELSERGGQSAEGRGRAADNTAPPAHHSSAVCALPSALSQQPITIALADALQHFAIPKSAFVALIDGCRQDMVKTRYETFAELLHYCDLVATSISDISLSIFGYRTEQALAYGRNLSTALQLTNVTRDIGDDVTRDRIYIPAEELRQFGVDEREISEHAENDRVRKLIEFQVARAERYFRDAEPLLRELDFDARFPTLLMGGVYATVLAKLRKDPLLAVRSRLSLSRFQKLRVIASRVLRPHFV